MTETTCWWAKQMAWNMASSDMPRAKPSIMVMALRVPETMRSRSDSSIWAAVGWMTSSSLTRPMRTVPVTWRKGMGETCRAAEAPIMERMSGSFWRSAAMAEAMICTSFM